VNRPILRATQTGSRIITVILLGALNWAVYKAAVNRNPMPVWAWIGLVALLSAAIGLAGAGVVDRGVVKEAGPFDFRPASRIAGHNVQCLIPADALVAGDTTLLRISHAIQYEIDASHRIEDAVRGMNHRLEGETTGRHRCLAWRFELPASGFGSPWPGVVVISSIGVMRMILLSLT